MFCRIFGWNKKIQIGFVLLDRDKTGNVAELLGKGKLYVEWISALLRVCQRLRFYAEVAGLNRVEKIRAERIPVLL